MFLKSTRRRGQGGVLPRSWMLPFAAATVALGTSTAHAQVSAYNALPPVKLTTVSHPLVLVTPTDSANALLADAAYEPITGGTLLVDGSQAATESNSVFGTGYTTYDQAPGFFGPGSWRPAAWAGVPAFVGNGAEIGVGNQTRNGPGLPIGFPFTFNSQVFDRIGISSQGWISFGKSTDGATAVRVHTSTAPATLNSPLANTAVINNDYRRNRVVAYGVQGGTWSGGSALVPYVFQSGYSGYPGSTLRMETIGTAPNRICVVQWDNFVIWPQGTLSAPDPSFFRFMNFQIRLHENGNKVEVRYGDCRRGPGVTSFNQIGLGGAAATDFNGWQRAAGWPTSWSGANYDTRVALPDPHEFTAMTANTQQISGSASGTPDMLSFMFTPPACPQQASAVNLTNLDTVSATLNWTGTGTFDYAISTTNNVAAATITGTVTGNSVLVTGLLPATTYYAFVRTNCDPDFSVWTPSVSFKTFIPVACGSQWTDPGGPTEPNPSTSYINTYVFCPENPAEKATVDFTTWTQMNWNLPQSSPMFIRDGYGLSAPLIPGTGTGYSCTSCSNGSASWSVPAGGWITEPPIITSTAATGCLTVQVYSFGLWVNDGWIADVTCAAPPTCFPPTNRAITARTPDGATFSWISSSPSDDFIVVANGGTPASPVLASGSSSTGTGSVSGLNANTQYTAFFRGSCDGGADLSAWSDPGLNFRTRVGCDGTFLMGDYAASVAVPLDSVVVICPDNVGDVVTVDFTDFYPGDRDLHMYVYDGPSTASYFLNSGQTTSPPGFPVGGYRLSGIANLPDVFTSTHSSGCLTFRFGATQPRFNLPPVNIAANVTCAPPPPCATPGAVTVSDIGGTSATVTWTGAGSDYILEFGPTGFTPGTGATAGVNGTVITNATSGTVLSLTVTTGYDVYVRQVCAGPTYSSNSFRSRFTTSIDCAQAIALDCGSFVTQPLVYETFGSSIYQGANYTQAACIASAGGGTGAERLYRITAPVAGTYQLDITGVPTVSTVSFLIAPATAGCGAGAFTCITNTVNSPTWPNAPMPSQHSLTLAAGDYYILVDPNAYAEGNITFRVNCPGLPPCVTSPTYPPNNSTLAVTGTGTVFTWPAAFGATSYDVYFQGNYVANTPTNSINGGSGYSTANIAALFGIGNTITWRVVPRNSFGEANCPTNYTFRVGGNGSANAIPLSEGVVRSGNIRASNGFTSNNSNNWGPDAWYVFTASPCATAVTVNLCPTGGITPTSSNAYSDNGFASVTVRRVTDNSQVLYMEDNSAGVTAGCVTAYNFDLGANMPPSFTVNPDESFYIIADGYGWQYNFDLSFVETVDASDFDGDGVPDCADSCVETPGEIGDPCYAGPLFGSGVINENCECEGQDPQPCNNDLTLEFQTDDAPWDITWELVEQGTNFVVQQGGPLNPQNSVETNFTCLPDGCFYLRVLDAAGDGMTTGGYILRNSGDNSRIIDNRNNFSTGEVSQIAGGQGFCLPIGDDKLIYSSCDKLDWVANKFIVASANPAVSAQFGVTNATSGYEFWFYDPNGSFSYRRFRSHATSDGFGTGATRACHFKVNGWFQNVNNPHLPANVLLNVRIRGRVAGNNLEFGPACQFKIDPTLAACPRVSLQDNPANTSDFSCGVFRNFGGAGNAANRIYANPPQPIPTVSSANVRYQFRFRIPGENICIVRPPQTSAQLTMNWTTGQLLQCSKTYEVDVRVSLNGGATWCFGPATSDATAACADTEAWGKVCNVTINPCAQASVNGGSSNLSLEGSTFTMYPNPNRGEQLFVSVSTVEAGVNTVNVDIFDMTGKRVVARAIAVQDGFVNTNLELNSELAAGIYMVNVTAGNKSYTERLVIQR